MSALLRARFPASIVSASAKGVPTRSNAGLSRLSMLSISPARSFMTSSPYLAAATKAKAKKDTITTAKKSVKKPAAKKAAAPKKKKVVKKVKEVVIVKPTPEMLPPKAPAGSSALFHAETSGKISESTQAAVREEFKRVTAAWNALSEPEKLEWTAKATEKRAQYLKDWESWYLSTHPAVFNLINKRRKSKGRNSISIPPELHHLKRPANSYTTYYKENYDRTKPTTENAKDIAVAWNALSKSEKERYTALAKANGEKWEKDIRARRYSVANPLAAPKKVTA